MNQNQLLREALQELMDAEKQASKERGGPWVTKTETRETQRRLMLAWKRAGAAIAQPAEGGEVVGWKLVPLEPTHDMKRAAIDVEIGDPEDRITMLTFDEARAVYRSMLNAAPPASQEQRREDFMAGYAAAEEDATICQAPPPGWHCTRKAGHDGPCAAVQNDDAELVQRGMDRLRAASQEQAQQPCVMPDFDDLPDEAIDNACAAGAMYRADFMRAWESLRSDLKAQQPQAQAQQPNEWQKRLAIRAEIEGRS